MNKVFTFLALVFLTAGMFAQSPEKISYQAVVRNSSNNLVSNTQIGMQISILQGSTEGTAVYVETQTPVTNDNGLVSVEIGTGTTSDNFADIDWGNGLYFIKTEIAVEEPLTTYTIEAVSQLLSVPYAMHAKTAESLTGTIPETDPVFSIWDKSTGISITESQVSDLEHFTNADETDPVFSAWDRSTGISITESQVSDLEHFTNTDETDPVFSAWDKSTGISITESQVSDLDHFTNADETDPVYSGSQAVNITAGDITNLGNLSGVNTGDQSLADVAAVDNSVNTQIKDLLDPTDPQDAVTKAYVDELLVRIEILEGTKFIDERDDNIYSVVQIGNQYWMGENLKYLPSVVGPGTDSNTDPYYYVFDYNGTDVNAAKATENYSEYGVLYNWAAAMAGEASSNTNPSNVQGICPSGWHLPSRAEWTELVTFLGGNTVAGGKLKEAGTTHWESPNTDATNETDFTALPGGWVINGTFYYDGAFGRWWTSTLNTTIYSYLRHMEYNSGTASASSIDNSIGISVRCVRD